MENPSQSVKLYCLPYAGGSAYTYHRFRRHLNPVIELVPLDPPGHGSRMDEPLLPSYEAMADDIFSRSFEAQEDHHGRFAFFGHSMGASLAFLLMRRLARAERPMPAHLFASGSAGPQVSPKFKDMYLLPDDAFIRALVSLGGMQHMRSEGPSLLDLFLPILKSDLKAASDFSLADERVAISVPVTLFFGDEDLITKGEEITWQAYTAAPETRFHFSGDHFFFLNHIVDIAKIINKTLKLL